MKKQNLHLKYQGIYKTDKEASQIVFDNAPRCESAYETIHSQINWMVDNFENVIDINVENTMDIVWYDLHGIYNKNIQNLIQSYTERLAEEKKIQPYLYDYDEE